RPRDLNIEFLCDGLHFRIEFLAHVPELLADLMLAGLLYELLNLLVCALDLLDRLALVAVEGEPRLEQQGLEPERDRVERRDLDPIAGLRIWLRLPLLVAELRGQGQALVGFRLAQGLLLRLGETADPEVIAPQDAQVALAILRRLLGDLAVELA